MCSIKCKANILLSEQSCMCTELIVELKTRYKPVYYSNLLEVEFLIINSVIFYIIGNDSIRALSGYNKWILSEIIKPKYNLLEKCL